MFSVSQAPDCVVVTTPLLSEVELFVARSGIADSQIHSVMLWRKSEAYEFLKSAPRGKSNSMVSEIFARMWVKNPEAVDSALATANTGPRNRIEIPISEEQLLLNRTFVMKFAPELADNLVASEALAAFLTGVVGKSQAFLAHLLKFSVVTPSAVVNTIAFDAEISDTPTIAAIPNFSSLDGGRLAWCKRARKSGVVEAAMWSGSGLSVSDVLVFQKSGLSYEAYTELKSKGATEEEAVRCAEFGISLDVAQEVFGNRAKRINDKLDLVRA